MLLPLRPKKHFGLRNIATNIHGICKGHLWPWWRTGLHKLKTSGPLFHNDLGYKFKRIAVKPN